MMHPFQTYQMFAGPYLADFVSPGGENNAILEAQCDHVLAKTEDVDGNLAELKAAMQWIKDSLPG